MITKNLIFDYDGTLVDSFPAMIEKFTLMADEFNLRKIRYNEIENLRDLTSRELIKYLQIPIYKLPSVLHSARKHMRSEMQILLPFKNLPEVLQELQNINISLGILTSNSTENVTKWLEYHKIQHLFNFIHVEASYFGKKQILQKILKTYKINKSQAFYIGDETRDMEAAKECEIGSIAVTWGFNSERILLNSEPDYIARKPEDLLSIFQ